MDAQAGSIHPNGFFISMLDIFHPLYIMKMIFIFNLKFPVSE
jgi:hypothetical protein